VVILASFLYVDTVWEWVGSMYVRNFGTALFNTVPIPKLICNFIYVEIEEITH